MNLLDIHSNELLIITALLILSFIIHSQYQR